MADTPLYAKCSCLTLKPPEWQKYLTTPSSSQGKRKKKNRQRPSLKQRKFGKQKELHQQATETAKNHEKIFEKMFKTSRAFTYSFLERESENDTPSSDSANEKNEIFSSKATPIPKKHIRAPVISERPPPRTDTKQCPSTSNKCNNALPIKTLPLVERLRERPQNKNTLKLKR